MSIFLSIKALVEDGVPKREIARRLGIDVRTVRKHKRRIEQGASGPDRGAGPGKLAEYCAGIEELVKRGMSAVQIYQELVDADGGFDASYATVRRLVRTLKHKSPEVFCRMRYAPGEEAQVDFGYVGRMKRDGKLRQTWLFVVTLCWSRYAYYELVTDQTVPTFLGAARRAFEFFGGAAQRLKPDNLKAAVLIDRLGLRHYQQDFFDFCRHYNTLPDAARPHTPTDKGRCERDIGYAKGNCFRGREFEDFDIAQAHLVRWRDEVANVRVHGTTQRRPVDLFAEEKVHLKPLPQEPYVICRFGKHKVRKDCHIAIDQNHYSVPYVHVGQEVLVRIGEEQITVYADGAVVATHSRSRDRGRTITDLEHYPKHKRIATQEVRRQRELLIRAAGGHAASYLGRLKESRFVKADQLMRLARLVAEYGNEALDRACQRALHYNALETGAITIERILARGLHDQPLPDTTPPTPNANDFARPMTEYEALLDRRSA